ncbi:hypothetical protein GOZ97_17535 [Agrobacterium vitis]|uniref:hypothetical protein n=1 Tax=Rhizobium/Agrobacterium group TaxID=227290 RepID=UPI0008DBFD01|nr:MULTISPECIES: hypothetical protein [Rhizobium/Agrobacterium group]MCF1433391.1 hypothetical protein [Allorhizobium ampelinum]MUO91384.1 hypothetical protein [Agrobacterium vitis]MUZ54511.1 hypothetical protein [Agrobacterium vitis]MUZ93230.1 hypothetical protein [Agrobacterium vitis]OHZ36173.1 hypothetical protein BBL07_16895 [Agrobacterium vitis]
MNCAPRPSDLIHSICQRLREFEQTGLQLAPDHVTKLLTNLRTVRELSRDMEEEMRILEYRLQMAGEGGTSQRKPGPMIDIAAGNVVRFPTRVRVIDPCGSGPYDGGDAA